LSSGAYRNQRIETLAVALNKCGAPGRLGSGANHGAFLSLLLLQDVLNLHGVRRALWVVGDEFDLLGAIHAQTQLHGAGDLFLLEDGPLADGWRGAEVAQDGYTDSINNFAIAT